MVAFTGLEHILATLACRLCRRRSSDIPPPNILSCCACRPVDGARPDDFVGLGEGDWTCESNRIGLEQPPLVSNCVTLAPVATMGECALVGAAWMCSASSVMGLDKLDGPLMRLVTLFWGSDVDNSSSVKVDNLFVLWVVSYNGGYMI